MFGQARHRIVGGFVAVLACAGVCVAPQAQAAGGGLVALGDSYSSGVGTRAYIDDGSGCQRSNYAYPKLVSDRLGTSLNFQACSGATVQNVIDNQLGALTSATQYVTLTVGGNDAGFTSVITKCAEPLSDSACDSRVDAADAIVENELPGRLDTLFTSIAAKSPSATVVVASYPDLFNGEDCNAGTWFSPHEEARLNATADKLAAVLSARASAHGFAFEDVRAAFQGHAVCDSPEWLNGLSNPITESYHPNRDGQASYADLVGSELGL